MISRIIKVSTSTDNPYLDLDYSGYHKTSSNDCLLLASELSFTLSKTTLFVLLPYDDKITSHAHGVNEDVRRTPVSIFLTGNLS